jgi:hypothetical protein
MHISSRMLGAAGWIGCDGQNCGPAFLNAEWPQGADGMLNRSASGEHIVDQDDPHAIHGNTPAKGAPLQ